MDSSPFPVSDPFIGMRYLSSRQAASFQAKTPKKEKKTHLSAPVFQVQLSGTVDIITQDSNIHFFERKGDTFFLQVPIIFGLSGYPFVQKV